VKQKPCDWTRSAATALTHGIPPAQPLLHAVPISLNIRMKLNAFQLLYANASFQSEDNGAVATEGDRMRLIMEGIGREMPKKPNQTCNRCHDGPPEYESGMAGNHHVWCER
jgi:hypothetical protein